jgi:chaperonin GroES
MEIQLLQDKLLVKVDDVNTVTYGGIIIPDTAKQKSNKGIVISVGLGKKDEPMTVKEGDKILFGKNVGTEIVIEGQPYLIMRESDIYAII